MRSKHKKNKRSVSNGRYRYHRFTVSMSVQMLAKVTKYCQIKCTKMRTEPNGRTKIRTKHHKFNFNFVLAALCAMYHSLTSNRIAQWFSKRIHSPFPNVNILLLSMTVFRFSMYIGSKSPSKHIYRRSWKIITRILCYGIEQPTQPNRIYMDIHIHGETFIVRCTCWYFRENLWAPANLRSGTIRRPTDDIKEIRSYFCAVRSFDI